MFKFEEYNKPYYQSNACVNYPCNYDFTRIHEYKYYLDDKSDKTVIAKEYSEDFERGKNERYYPIPKEMVQEVRNRLSPYPDLLAILDRFTQEMQIRFTDALTRKG